MTEQALADGVVAARKQPKLRKVSRGLGIAGWLGLILIGTVLLLETISLGVYYYELREIQRVDARDRAAMSMLWAAKAIEAVPPEIQDLVAASFGQSNRIMYLQDKSGILEGDTELPDWGKKVADWLRSHDLNFAGFKLAARTVYLPKRPDMQVVYHRPPDYATLYARRLIALPRFPDGRTPSWVLRGPNNPPEDESKFRVTRAFIYSMQLEDGRYLNMYALTPITARRGIFFKLVFMSVATLLVLSVAVLVGAVLMRPFNRLRRSVEVLARGENPEPVPMTGPADVRDVIGAFNQMSQRIRQNSEYLVSLLYSLGHDVRVPLTTARALLSHEKFSEEDKSAVIERISRADDILSGIMQFTRNLSSDEALGRTDLVSLAEAVAEDLAPADDTVVVGGDDIVFVECRFNAIERVLQNLVSNGLKYGNHVWINVSSADGRAVLTIDDDGPGIAEEDREELFKPFRRKTVAGDDQPSTGLGLAIAKAIVLDHDGEITLSESPQGGLRVTVSLPQ